MSEKKGFLGGLFGKKQKSCCNIEIIEESTCDCNNDNCCSAEKQSSEKSANKADNVKNK